MPTETSKADRTHLLPAMQKKGQSKKHLKTLRFTMKKLFLRQCSYTWGKDSQTCSNLSDKEGTRRNTQLPQATKPRPGTMPVMVALPDQESHASQGSSSSRTISRPTSLLVFTSFSAVSLMGLMDLYLKILLKRLALLPEIYVATARRDPPIVIAAKPPKLSSNGSSLRTPSRCVSRSEMNMP